MRSLGDRFPRRTRLLLVEALVTRFTLFVTAFAAALSIPDRSGSAFHHIASNPFVDMMWRWDTPFYAAIAVNGYGWQHGQWNGGNTFFPGYPMLLRPLLTLLQSNDKALALGLGILLSNIFLAVTVIYLDKLVRLDYDERTARHVRWLIWTAPMSIFFAGMYSESMFLFACVVTLYLARRGKWHAAAIAAMLAGLTRTTGLALVFPLFYEAWHTGFQRKHLFAILAPIASFVFYPALVGWQLGDWTAYFQITSSEWNRTFALPWEAFTAYFSSPLVLFGFQPSLFDLFFTVSFALLALAVFRLRISYGLFSAGIVILPLFSGMLVSMPRYVAVAFPIYLLIAEFIKRSRNRQIAVYGLSICAAVIVIARFVNWYWVA